MSRHRAASVLIAGLLLLAHGAMAQEAVDCSAVEADKARLEQQVLEASQNDARCQESIKQLSLGLEGARTDIASYKASVEAKDAEALQLRQQAEADKASYEASCQASVSSGQASLTSCQNSLASAQTSAAAQATQAQTECAATVQRVRDEYAAQLQAQAAQVAQLQAQLASKSAVNASELLAAVVESAKEFATCTVNEIKSVATGLQQGDTTQLSALFHKVTAHVASAARAGYAVALGALDKHLPFVKQYAAEAWAVVNQQYEKYLGDAAWVAELKKLLVTVHNEIHKFLAAQVKAYSALKFLDDPVNMQLLVYAVFALPLVLLFLPVLLLLATCFAPASKAAPTSSSKSSKKKKSKAPAAARVKAA